MTGATATSAHRDDPAIFGDARSALDSDPNIPATVRVHVRMGLVTLTGNVRLPSERAHAADAVRHVSGVRGIVNKISVAHIPSTQGYEPPDDCG